MQDVPVKILTQIYGYASLESAVALGQTCVSCRSLFTDLEDSMIRDKVLARVPWMIKDESGTGLTSWGRCALLVVARRRSMAKNPEKWAGLTPTNLETILKNTNISYKPGNRICGESLPDSFKPMFPTFQFCQPETRVRGQYMHVLDGHALDVVSFDWFKKMPVAPIPTYWHGEIRSDKKYNTIKCPLSGIILSTSEPFILEQESDTWVVIYKYVRTQYRYRRGVKYVVNKNHATNGLLVFKPEMATKTLSLDDQCRLLPGDQGLFVMAFGQGQVAVCYVDLRKTNANMIQLGAFPGTSNDYSWPWTHRAPAETGQELRDFVIPYGGMMWVQYKEKALIPLWIDMGDEPRDGVYVDQSMVSLTTPSIRIKSSGAQSMRPGHHPFKLGKSAEGRLVAHQFGWGRMVGDLATGSTYIVRDSGYKGRAGLCFVSCEDSPHIPKFYTIDVDWSRTMMYSWMPPFEGEESEYSKEKYLAAMEYNYGTRSIWECKMLDDYPMVDDQNEEDGKLNISKDDYERDGYESDVFKFFK